jgi:hypothetical protein
MIAKKRKKFVIIIILCFIIVISIGAVTLTNVTQESEIDVTPEFPLSASFNDLTNEKTFKDFFAINTGKNFDYLDKAFKNNYLMIMDEPIISNSNGVTLTLDHYILTPEDSRIVFKVSGVPEEKIESKVNANPDYSKNESDYTIGTNYPNIISKLILKDEEGKLLFDSDRAKIQPALKLISNLYEKSDGVFLEIVLVEPDDMTGQMVNLQIPDILNIEVDNITFGSSSAIDGQWQFALPVDDIFKNINLLCYETTNIEYCDENGIYVDNFYSTATATRMELTIDNSKNLIQQPTENLGFSLFEDPDTHFYKIPNEQKLFIIADGYDSAAGSNGEYKQHEKTDKGIRYFLYFPTLYFANAKNVTVRVLDDNRKPLEVNLQLNTNSANTYQNIIPELIVNTDTDNSTDTGIPNSIVTKSSREGEVYYIGFPDKDPPSGVDFDKLDLSDINKIQDYSYIKSLGFQDNNLYVIKISDYEYITARIIDNQVLIILSEQPGKIESAPKVSLNE